MKATISCLLLLSLTLCGCEGFLNVDPPTSKIPRQLVFQDDAMATSAIAGIYTDLYSSTSFAGGTTESVVTLAGLSSDELKNSIADPPFLQFEKNDINPSAANVQTLWSSMYKTIYEANAVIAGLDASSSITAEVKNQLKGEALFVRAFAYFYLINLFGDVPLALTPDYQINSSLDRTPVKDVYVQIKTDLTAAEDLIGTRYVGTARVRPNKFAASALLSRVYLYEGDWARAEDKATNVISQKDLYALAANVNDVFQSTSREAIWQLKPRDNASYTNEGYYFSPLTAPQYNVLNDKIFDSLETGDLRGSSWITSSTSAGSKIYLPYKYRRYLLSGLTDEYSMVIRLAELYLIRAEARIQQDKVGDAISDIDIIRQRAGLPSIAETRPAISKDDFMTIVENERKIEFLVEWGHRWLDVKRWTHADARLSKPNLSNTDLLYPIPTNEITKNPRLKPQNDGY
jgi:hypothetical protein